MGGPQLGAALADEGTSPPLPLAPESCHGGAFPQVQCRKLGPAPEIYSIPYKY